MFVEEMDRNRMVQGTQVCVGNTVYMVPYAELPACLVREEPGISFTRGGIQPEAGSRKENLKALHLIWFHLPVSAPRLCPEVQA